ncbi:MULTISPECIES: hypothetical protein [unclassified Thermoactinomyces]|jgi:cytochrome c oxidase subunit IV|uniref:hypothetical protein n=1 Tax=unclassified Thermoactinomyces TaxID=2634588 RepID=UPI0018DD10B2|nr:MULTISPECIES: hypothetical protein [unclassified Thermoactinomyces]MBH8599682.1 hypothetical protein [Thermoactinomyces sp. CICC 10523]MBH8608715.1 hypothetical protein [Thermoactinomyces sp. CICC 10521]
MKYLTAIFLLALGIVAAIGTAFKWPGYLTWSLIILFFILAAYSTKFLNLKNKEIDKSE